MLDNFEAEQELELKFYELLLNYYQRLKSSKNIHETTADSTTNMPHTEVSHKSDSILIISEPAKEKNIMQECLLGQGMESMNHFVFTLISTKY